MDINGWILGAHLFTAHVAGGFEPVNPGIYARSAEGFTAGAFRNSYGRLSVYGGMTWEAPGGHLALTAGLVTGYPGSTVYPLIAPSVRVGLGERYSARFTVLPKPPRGAGSAALHLSVERSF